MAPRCKTRVWILLPFLQPPHGTERGLVRHSDELEATADPQDRQLGTLNDAVHPEQVRLIVLCPIGHVAADDQGPDPRLPEPRPGDVLVAPRRAGVARCLLQSPPDVQAIGLMLSPLLRTLQRHLVLHVHVTDHIHSRAPDIQGTVSSAPHTGDRETQVPLSPVASISSACRFASLYIGRGRCRRRLQIVEQGGRASLYWVCPITQHAVRSTYQEFEAPIGHRASTICRLPMSQVT